MQVSKEKIIFIFILFLGCFLRILHIANTSGLWHDEVVMYNQANAVFPFGIIKESLRGDIHFPLYQLLLAVWMKIFSNNDIVLRLFSVITGVFTIIFAFITRKEARDEKLGNIFAFLTSINITLIYYSQEVKFYSMLAMLSVLGLMFIFKIKNKNNLSNYAGYILINAAIIYTFTIGIFYVIAEFFVFGLYFFLNEKRIFKRFMISNFLLILLLSPFIYYIVTHFAHYKSPAWIFYSDFTTPFVIIQNYFSPILTGVYDNPALYIPKLNVLNIIFIFIPIILCFYGIFRAIKENKNNLFILFIPIIFLLLEFILTYNSGLRILTRYTILALMPLLFLVSNGFYLVKQRLLKIILCYFFMIYIFSNLYWPVNSSEFGYRFLGQKPVANILISNKIKKNDILIISLRKNDLDKYLESSYCKKFSMQYFLYKDYSFDRTKPNKYEGFRDYIFDDKKIHSGYENYFLNNVILYMEKGSRIFLVFDKGFNLYPFNDKENYQKYPVLSLALSKMFVDTENICKKYMDFENEYQLKYYRILIFKKV